MEENILTKQDLEQANLVNEWVKVTTPAKSVFLENRIFNVYGRFMRVTDEYILLFSKRYGFKRIFIGNVLYIGKAQKPEGE